MDVAVQSKTAANYLNIRSLFELTCQAMADMMRGKTPEEIRATFNILVLTKKQKFVRRSLRLLNEEQAMFTSPY
ncbi:hypothetical protein L6164_037467 [Bauhinia variegata]|uniref:Uncharacterized protein n=1 Tax=Bauhinia variegata TaxID=167791 RepID=A0ACB9KKW8_BAUVA|nr:hypothetical protein L6164_037467 [Bauhinia variegata]